MTSRPHVFTVRSSDDRLPARRDADRPPRITGRRTHSQTGLQVRAADFGAFCPYIAVLARDACIRPREPQPTDESLESVFAYLVVD